jgi:hypothetical protein
MENLRLHARNSDSLGDLCDGARYARIQATLPVGTSALTSILFFDEIQRDEKCFVSGEGIIIVGGFFSKDARESSYAKVSLRTFPKTGVAKKDAIEWWRKGSRKLCERHNMRPLLNATVITMQKGAILSTCRLDSNYISQKLLFWQFMQTTQQHKKLR